MGDGFSLSFCGAGYGLLLFGCAFLAAGFGHGTYLPFAVFGAPLSLVDQKIGLFAVLFVWPIGGFILGASRRLIWPTLFLLAHAVAVGWILWHGTPFERADEQWTYFDQARGALGGAINSGFAIYVTGQCVAWLLLGLRKWQSASDGNPMAG